MNTNPNAPGYEGRRTREERRALLEAMTGFERGLVLAYITGLAPGVFDEAVDGCPSVDAAELAARIGGAR